MVTFSFYIQKKALKPFGFQRFTILISDPEGILTLDLQNRNLTFYTAELRSHSCFAGTKIRIFPFYQPIHPNYSLLIINYKLSTVNYPLSPV